jgi:type II restriction/modification system DNA methylase subunit YeeA
VTYPADRDGILPITDDEYFQDDIVSMFIRWVKTVYGEEMLEENLQFIANALNPSGASAREVIRSYFLNDFYADHLKIYQKRPIYWQFDSGKQNGFKALMYLHRYDQDTVARLRTDYVHELQDRYRTQLDDARKTAETGDARQRSIASKRAQKLDKQLTELNKYEELVHHYADMRIPLDLDDGVKVNYVKLQEILTKIK